MDSRQRVGTSRLVQLQARQGRRSERGRRWPLPRHRHNGSAHRRCFDFSPHPRFFHRHTDLHDQREGGGRDRRRRALRQHLVHHSKMATTDTNLYEYVVVGSGAGGGTVAARLAEWGHRVLLLEAGGDPRLLEGGDKIQKDVNRLPADYDVPLFHAIASENEAMSWEFFVKHYKDPALAKLDDKHYDTYKEKPIDGVFYPRAGSLGGCTAHNAPITVYPHNKDWEYIQDLTKDPSWAPKKMRKYFQRMENCHHRPFWRWVHKLTRINPTRHGFGGWLHTQVAIPKAAIKDKSIQR